MSFIILLFCFLMEEQMINVIIRKYQEKDCEELAKLFYDTVHNVNCKDYTKEQLDVWATGEVNIQQWNTSFWHMKALWQ